MCRAAYGGAGDSAESCWGEFFPYIVGLITKFPQRNMKGKGNALNGCHLRMVRCYVSSIYTDFSREGRPGVGAALFTI